jgi:putative glutamine amidotransferase
MSGMPGGHTVGAKPKRKVLVVNDRYEFGSYHAPFAHLGEYTSNPKILDYAPELVVCVVFTGGADVDPKLYGQTPCLYTSSTVWRDTHEMEIMDRCRELGLPMFGICRGAQLMTVAAGGKLCQHLTHHGFGKHLIKTHDGENVVVNSWHHQMMLPPEDAEILAWCDPKISSFYLGDGGEQIEVDKEVEVVHYPKLNGLAVQYHPELHNEWDEGWVYYQDLITDFLYTAKYTVDDGETPTMLQKSA